MIPSGSGFLTEDFTITEQPTKTYKMNLERNSINGYAEGQEAMKQAVYKILSTERYQYVIYPWSYGVEFRDLYGEPVTYVVPELERRITEALTQDDRITDVSDFEFDISKRGIVAASFIVHTTFGDVQGETEVNF